VEDPAQDLLDGWRTLAEWERLTPLGGGPGHRVWNRLVDRLTAIAERALLDPAVVERLTAAARSDPDPGVRFRVRQWLEPDVPAPGLPLEHWLGHPLVRLDHLGLDLEPGIVVVPESARPPATLAGERDRHTWLLGTPSDDGQPWPRRCDGVPLAHLLQVELGGPEQEHEGWHAPLPGSGVLQVFHDLEATGDDPHELAETRWLIRHVADPGRTPAPPPDDLGDAHRPRRPAVRRLTWTVPSPLDVELTDEESERLDLAHEHVMRTATDDPWRRDLGDHVEHWPLLLGHSPLGRNEAVERLAGVLPTDGPDDYVMLLDIPGVGPFEDWFGDEGHLEVWIRDQDLRAHRLDLAWPLLRS